MKKKPSLILREPVKLYENKKTILQESVEVFKKEEESKNLLEKENKQIEIPKTAEPKNISNTDKQKEREKMSPRVQQIWDYFCSKAKLVEEEKKSFSLTRAEVMKEAGIGSTNTYRDALKKFKELKLMEIELRPGVNSGSIFTFTEQGIEELRK